MRFRIDPRKITDYLLAGGDAPTPEAMGKARFFQAKGFRLAAWQALHDAILRHPDTAALETEGTVAATGQRKLIFRCALPPTPSGDPSCCVRSVWTEQADGAFWLSTAYPRRP